MMYPKNYFCIPNGAICRISNRRASSSTLWAVFALFLHSLKVKSWQPEKSRVGQRWPVDKKLSSRKPSVSHQGGWSLLARCDQGYSSREHGLFWSRHVKWSSLTNDDFKDSVLSDSGLINTNPCHSLTHWLIEWYTYHWKIQSFMSVIILPFCRPSVVMWSGYKKSLSSGLLLESVDMIMLLGKAENICASL